MEGGNGSLESLTKLDRCLAIKNAYKISHDITLDSSICSSSIESSPNHTSSPSHCKVNMKDKPVEDMPGEDGEDKSMNMKNGFKTNGSLLNQSTPKVRKKTASRRLPSLPLRDIASPARQSLAEEIQCSLLRNSCQIVASSSESSITSLGNFNCLENQSFVLELKDMESDTEDYKSNEPQKHCDPASETYLSDSLHLDFNTTSTTTSAFLGVNNPYLMEDSSPEEKSMKRTSTHNSVRTSGYLTQSSSSSTISSDANFQPTHRGAHRFIPRHEDEFAIEIGDPLYVDLEADDLWCEGMNLRTGQRGVFPAVYATDLKFLEEDVIKSHKLKPAIFLLRFLGSVEVNGHRGYDTLVQAINKVILTRRMTLNTSPPPLCSIEINECGIKMIDRTKVPKVKQERVSGKDGKIAQRLKKILALSKSGQACCNHFFSLKNVSFCGSHPKNPKYFGFITKHPTEMRFACHVFVSEQSTQHVGEAVGHAFQKFYAEYMAFSHPTEDIYME